jgi:exodeoxyribonuclease VII large subunit
MNELFDQDIFTVGRLTGLIKQSLELSFSHISVEGEISNFRPAASGHWYFQLSDASASLQAVMFKQHSWKLGFVPQDGDKVIVEGSISVYEKRGVYQIICTGIRKSGLGEILVLLQKRKEAFAAKGYFDQQRKKPLPLYPKRVGIITSPTGAAIHDIVKTLKRRSPFIQVMVLPAIVQGDGAADTIARQIITANQLAICDVLIVGRGGGSLEDLLAFSETVVVEAIVGSAIPIISAVGHETDWALSDYAADHRASTPTAAAELVSENWFAVLPLLTNSVALLAHLMRNRITSAISHSHLYSAQRMQEYVMRAIEKRKLLIDDEAQSQLQQIQGRLSASKQAFLISSALLHSLSVSHTLERGFAIVTKESHLISSTKQLQPNDELEIAFKDGTAEVKTLRLRPPRSTP